MEWGVQSGLITKNRVLPVATYFFWKCYFSLKTSYKELIRRRWSFIWGWVLRVSIHKPGCCRKHLLEARLTEFTQQTFVALQDVLKTSSKHVFKTSSTRLQRNNFSSSKTSWRRLANTSWRHLARRLEDVLEDKKLLRWRRLEDVLKTCLEDVLEINKMFTRISVLIHGLLRNLNQYLTNLYFTNQRRIQNALIRTQ